jgi:hypothetical protein
MPMVLTCRWRSRPQTGAGALADHAGVIRIARGDRWLGIVAPAGLIRLVQDWPRERVPYSIFVSKQAAATATSKKPE